MTALCSYNGCDAQPHGILLNVTVKLYDKIVLIDIEVFTSCDVQPHGILLNVTVKLITTLSWYIAT